MFVLYENNPIKKFYQAIAKKIYMLYNDKKTERLLIMSKKEKKVKEKKEKVTTPEKEAQKSLIVRCVAALLCAVIVCISLNAAFGKIAEAVKASESVLPVVGVVSGNNDSTDAPSTDTPADVPSDVPADTPSDVPADTPTDAPADTPTDAPSTDAPANKPADSGSKAPQTKAEVVAYFNTAVNKVKTNAKAVDQKSVTNYLAASPTIPSGLSGIYKMLGGDSWLDDMLKKNGQGAATYTGADIKAKFPVEGESYASKLTAADVSSYSCTEKNGVYTIKLTTVADAKSADVKHGGGHAPKAFNVILPGVVNDNIPGIATSLVGTATMNYPASTVVITVDAKTGNVLTADYDLKWTINFDKMGAVIPLGSKSIYTIKW